MPRTSMTFRVDLLHFETGEWHELLVTPGDYIRMSKWADDAFPERADDPVSNLRMNYATAWFALKRMGRLGEFGLPDEIDVEALDEMADVMSVYVDEYRAEDGTPPLSGTPPTS